MPLISNFRKLFAGQDKSESVPTQTSISPTSTCASDIAPSFSLASTSSASNELYPDLPSNYKLLSILGEGAFSTVYKAVDTHNPGQTLAIKIINKINLSGKQLNNIKNEINIMKKTSTHQNLLKLYNYYNTPNYCFLILEYCDGGEIFNKIIEYTYFSEPLSKHVFKQLLSAIEYLHSQNIVHRDIKPENLLFMQIPYVARSTGDFKKHLRKSDDDSKIDEGVLLPNIGGGTIGVIKLADYGLAKQLPKSDLSGNQNSNLKTPCGTAGYTAPEVITCSTAHHHNNSTPGGKKKLFSNTISKQNYYSKAVDIWSLGCFLYTILCGFPPFYDDVPNELTLKILSGNYEFLKPWWDEVSEDAKNLITKMLTINPEERITIEEIWEHPWVKEQASTANYFHGNQYVVKSFDATSPLAKTAIIDKLKPSSEHVEFSNNEPLTSPRAEAIKKVFDNPAMTGATVLPSVSGVDATAEIVSSARNKSLPIIGIAEESEDSARGTNLKTSAFRVSIHEDIFDTDSFSSSSTEHCIIKSICSDKKKKALPRTPNPTDNELDKLNFKDVFNVGAQTYVDDDEDEGDQDEESESEKNDRITSLGISKKRNSGTATKSKFEESILAGVTSDDAEVSSTNSISDVEDQYDDDVRRDDDDAEMEYQTRCSSIISGINGDFKFTLNLNESNLLSRRRSSTVSKSLNKSSSNTSTQATAT